MHAGINHQRITLNCHGRLLTFDEPRVMGILNITPDSFYSGSRVSSVDAALRETEKMLTHGADIIDVGGASSRPGAAEIAPSEELKRVLPVIDALVNHFPGIIISIDTYRSEVAKAAVEHGAAIVNDISGGNLDSGMFETVARLKVPYILMHMRGTPATMQQHTSYQDIITDILDDLIRKINRLRSFGVEDIIIDPGFGFSKTADQNYVLLKHLSSFKIPGYPLLAGLSRKSMIWKVTGKTPGEALTGTIALNAIALLNGADILRVHDVKEAKETIAVVKKYARVQTESHRLTTKSTGL